MMDNLSHITVQIDQKYITNEKVNETFKIWTIDITVPKGTEA